MKVEIRQFTEGEYEPRQHFITEQEVEEMPEVGSTIDILDVPYEVIATIKNIMNAENEQAVYVKMINNESVI